MKNGLTDRHYLRQSPSLINANYSLNNSESNLFYALLTEIKKEDKDFKDYSFTKNQLEVKLGIELNTTQLRTTAKSLMRKVFEVVRSEEDWELMGFSNISYKNGVVTCRFDKALKPYLLDLKQYALADIRYLVQMKGEYSKRIYLMLKEYDKIGHRKLEIKKLMEQMEVPKSYYRYSQFKQKVLTQAVKDINLYTDFEIQNIGTSEKPIYFKENKFLRKVESVTFEFKKNHTDLKTFISWIRELYVNVPLYTNTKGQVLKCSEKGLLYYADTLATLNKETALKAWEWLHEHRERLLCFKVSEEEMKKRIEDMKNGLI